MEIGGRNTLKLSRREEIEILSPSCWNPRKAIGGGAVEERTRNCPIGAPQIFDFWSNACHGSQCPNFCPH